MGHSWKETAMAYVWAVLAILFFAAIFKLVDLLVYGNNF